MPTEEPSTTFKVLLVASEFLIPLIIFIGVYFIFKPVFGKDEKKKKGKNEESVNQFNRGADS
ncbi:hypothetical protein GYB22_08985 [bacterium]|nr:hypothetical protein [bacterium]